MSTSHVQVMMKQRTFTCNHEVTGVDSESPIQACKLNCMGMFLSCSMADRFAAKKKLESILVGNQGGAVLPEHKVENC